MSEHDTREWGDMEKSRDSVWRIFVHMRTWHSSVGSLIFKDIEIIILA